MYEQFDYKVTCGNRNKKGFGQARGYYFNLYMTGL
jgi:hypothetical protein